MSFGSNTKRNNTNTHSKRVKHKRPIYQSAVENIEITSADIEALHLSPAWGHEKRTMDYSAKSMSKHVNSKEYDYGLKQCTKGSSSRPNQNESIFVNPTNKNSLNHNHTDDDQGTNSYHNIHESMNRPVVNQLDNNVT